MTYYGRWRRKQTATIRKGYECDYCIRNEIAKAEGRICFLYGEEKAEVVFPIIDKDGKVVEDDYLEEVVDVDEFRERLASISGRRPENVFRLLVRYFGGGGKKSFVCPISIVEPYISSLVMMAARCESYHVLPCSGSVVDQPNWLMEALDEFRKTNAEYDGESLEEK